MDEGLRQWLIKIESKVDTAVETSIRLEAKVDALAKENHEAEAVQRAHEVRIASLEKELARHDGALKMLQLLGGVVVGLAVIGTVVVMIVK